jgi:hypothetical protein
MTWLPKGVFLDAEGPLSPASFQPFSGRTESGYADAHGKVVLGENREET